MIVDKTTVGAMNLYAHQERAFDEEAAETGMLFASQAAVVLSNANAYWDSRALSERLGEAMEHRALIEQAKGMLMAAQRCTGDHAFDLLVKASQRENVKLRDIAARLVAEANHRATEGGRAVTFDFAAYLTDGLAALNWVTADLWIAAVGLGGYLEPRRRPQHHRPATRALPAGVRRARPRPQRAVPGPRQEPSRELLGRAAEDLTWSIAVNGVLAARRVGRRTVERLLPPAADIVRQALPGGAVMAADQPERSLPPVTFEAEVISVTEARHRLVDFLHDVPDETRHLAALLVSELTTNVVRHAGTPFSLCADVTAEHVRVEVADGTSEPAVVRRPPPTSLGGRGVWLISELADSWGSEPTGNGKMVWFELSLVKPEVSEEVGDFKDSTNDR